MIFTERVDTTSWPQLLKVSYSGRGTQGLATSSELWQEKNTHGWKGATLQTQGRLERVLLGLMAPKTGVQDSGHQQFFKTHFWEWHAEGQTACSLSLTRISATLTSPDESQSCSSTKHISVSAPACSLVNRPHSTPQICSQQPFPPSLSSISTLPNTTHPNLKILPLYVLTVWVCSPSLFLVLRQHLVFIHQPTVICSMYMVFFQIYHKFLLKHLIYGLRMHVC